MTKVDALARLESAGLPPALYRTARRILDLVHDDNGYVRIDYATGRALVETESDETVRGHLARLSSAGLITVRRNAAIHIYWHGWENEQPALLPDDDAGKSARNRAKSARIPREIRAEENDDAGKSARNRADSARIPREIRADVTPETDDFAEPDYISTTTTIVVVDDNNNYASSSSSSSAPQTADVPIQPQAQTATRINAPADFARVRDAYEQNIGMMTPILLPAVREAMRLYGCDMVVMAIERAVRAEVRRWNYVEGILRNWAAEGYGNGTRENQGMGNTAGRRAGGSGHAAGSSQSREPARQEAPAGIREWLIAQGRIPAAAD